MTINDFQQLSPTLWEIPRSYRPDMRVPARIYTSQEMLEEILHEEALEQLVNVATLPGIDRYALAMPDIHQGYGFPIGGVAAIRPAKGGVISPGGVGYDINCGVRLLTSQLRLEDLKDHLLPLANQMQRDVPSGLGRGGRLKLNPPEIDEVLNNGLNWAVKQGFAGSEDQDSIEENGCFKVADAKKIPPRAKQRGADQLGTLGAGNHFLEIQEVVEVFNKDMADKFGLFLGQAVVMIHTGSRGLGHETCSHYVKLMKQVMDKYSIHLKDQQLACAPVKSPEGQDYFAAMAAASNYAYCNRQLITHLVRQAWQKVLSNEKKAKLKILYDVSHNNAKLEKHQAKEYLVHRKGATRAFPDQPVFIPGSMGTFSYVLSGTTGAMEQTFGTTCHGAGRRMSRTQAKRTVQLNELKERLKSQGIIIRATSKRGMLEEAPEAYKDVNQVVEVVSQSHIAQKVAQLKPVVVIIG